jgi:hypothetical protein
VVAKFKLLATFSNATATVVAMLLCSSERKYSSVCCTQYDVGLCTGAPQLRWTGVVVLRRRSRETSPKSGDTLMRLSNGIIITFGDGNRVKFFGAREKPSYTANCKYIYIYNIKYIILYWSGSSYAFGNNILHRYHYIYAVNTAQK